MKKKNERTKLICRVLAIVLAGLLLLGLIPIVWAADAVVNDIGGVRTVFVAGFGKINYNGKAYVAFKDVNQAVAALGTEGGRIVFTGNLNFAGFTDIPGRKPLTIAGHGTQITGCAIQIPEDMTSIKLEGDLALDFLTISAPEGFAFDTNGYSLTVSENFDTYYYITSHITNERAYSALPDALISGDVSSVTLGAGKIGLVGIGGNTTGKSVIFLRGGEYEEGVYAGVANGSAATVDGDVLIKITDGTYQKAYAGSASSGTVNGNVTLDISGGEFSGVVAGSESAGGKINGNAVVSIDNVFISNVGAPANGSVSGKVIYVTDREIKFADNAFYNYYVVTDGGLAKPVFEGTNFLGFRFVDENGCVTQNVTVNGAPITPVNGIFTLPEGKTVAVVSPEINLELNKYASYVSGYSDGTFLPQNNLSRAEAITMLSRLVVDENTIKGKLTSDYTDVASGAWYEPYIGLFESLGYLDTVAVDGGTKITPDAKITRGEFVEIARNVLRLMNPRSFEVKEFSDVPSSHPYCKSIGEIGYLGIVGGYEDGTFKPDNNITRAEVVTIINRMLSREATGSAGGNVFSDAVGHWAEGQIIMAANPANVNGVEIWKIDGDVTLGNFKLIEGDATLDQQIVNLYNIAKNGTALDATSGVDSVSNWQIENIVYSESDLSGVTGTKYYVSPNGNNANDGLSPETAWQTLTKVNLSPAKPGDAILFERGGLWRGRFTAREGITYSAYGEGEKPRFYGSLKNYADETLWEPTQWENVWELTDVIREDVGVIVFNSSYEMGDYNETVGRKVLGEWSNVSDASCLKSDLQFYYRMGHLFLYSTDNPGKRFESIEIGSNGSLVTISGNNIVIDNLHFRYHGGHVVGTGGKQNITSQNCIYAYTGGSVLSGTTLYGNAFESYGECDGWYAYNNWIYQIYDTGVTHQYTPTTGRCVQKNVKYIGNVIEYCHWSIEYYNRESEDGSERLVQNIEMLNNICRMNGYGWGSRGRASWSTMFCSANITQHTENFVARNNILDRSAGNILQISSAGDKELILENNIYIQNMGGSMGPLKTGTFKVDDNIVSNLANSTVEEEPLVIINNDVSIIDNIKKF